MKISIHVDKECPEMEIAISCASLTPELERVLATLRMLDKQLTVKKDDETHILEVSKVIYIEAVERKVFVYTEEAVYETNLRLYELEQRLEEYGFFRVSKCCLIQLRYIKSLKADIDRRIRLTLENGEQIIVSRQYADALKQRLGVK